MIESLVLPLLKRHEGLRLRPYKCTAGKLTIGYGRNLEDNGITTEEADILLRNDVMLLEQELYENISFYHELDQVRQAALLDMAYNLGISGLLKFKKTLAFLKNQNWELAAKEMLNSKWAEQVKGRSVEISEMIKTGKMIDKKQNKG